MFGIFIGYRTIDGSVMLIRTDFTTTYNRATVRGTPNSEERLPKLHRPRQIKWNHTRGGGAILREKEEHLGFLNMLQQFCSKKLIARDKAPK